ncbi:MAG: HEAT repeat domain-containing protein [Candidatus Binatia bacterium]
MARGKALEATLARLAAARAEPTSPASIELLREVLAGRSSHAAAQAAAIAAAHEIAALTPALVAAFEHFLEDPIKRDPGCAAKQAIADALYRIGAPDVAVYERGIRHVQLEPVFGGKQDAAVQLRGTCALALVRVHHPDYLLALAELLADREAPARRMAAQALGYSENPAAQPLLRLKALLGDEEPQVLSECLLALLAIAPQASLDFVAAFLDRRPPEIAEAAALALGGARLPAALPLLIAWWERTFDADLRRTALLAIAMLKTEAALDHLLGLVADAAAPHATAAIAALALYRHDARLHARVAAALAARRDPALERAFGETFGDR